ncbi:hypothetical protein SARC_09242 [Sphaeroforma arctica JP610]|uniref:Uncharacterized protein n=1 Tax=Sphaeroforma arctica JP610 TaxID=667725 RepID=A0A0L0FNM1_9EUKA|nr:hypothetical protein SARC_09242 [Sphaeroforma arctica JP610]KNC78329.1 hypothetical protein SARC_09242 [Sphaeroforma arctica JP610]|eukprot:XP_014152231.1 hypothetical protein SARC_09242 [Sphaeroforma arctica JP610]
MKFYSTALLMAATSAMVMAASPAPMEHMCSPSNNNDKCEGLNKHIDTNLHCNLSGDDKCSTSYCCKDKHDDDDNDDDDEMMCAPDNNQGKCESLGKKIDKHVTCYRYGDEKCTSSHCCKDHHGDGGASDHDDDDKGDKMKCSHDINQGKCKSLGKDVDKARDLLQIW